MPTHKLNVEYNEKLSFWKVTCPEGDYVTTYADTDDITTYYGGKEAYLPKFFSENQIRAVYRCITEKEQGAVGEVSGFGALCISLSATLGTGNIVGVATAITLGGPGALFWMQIAAFFGMAT